MKLDKDTLIKQRFWFLLGAATLLAFVPFFILWFPERSKNSTKKAEREKEIKDTNRPTIRNDSFVKLATEVADREKQNETKVWGTAWEPQAVLATFPGTLQKKLNEALYALEVKAVAAAEGGGGTPPEEPKDDGKQFHGTV